MSTPDLYKSSHTVSGGSRSRSGSVSYDYSQLDEKDKIRQAIDSLDAKKFQSLYEGDVGGAMAIAKQQRGLLAELAKPASVRIRSKSSRSANSGPSESVGFKQAAEEDYGYGAQEGAREPQDIPEAQAPRQTPKPQEPTEGLIMPEMDMNMNPIAGLRPKTFRPYV